MADARGGVRDGGPCPVWIALALTAAILLLDVLLPGVPRFQGGLVGRLAALVSGVCLQRPSHSYILGGVQLPLEARLTGTFGGLLLGAVELATIGRRRLRHWPRPPVLATTLAGVGVMALDGFNALFFDLGLPHAYTPDLRIRLATGVLTGIALAFALVPALLRAAPPIGADIAIGWRDLGWSALAGGAFAGLVASGWAPLLYPVALLSSAGVVLTLLLATWLALRDVATQVGVGARIARSDRRLGALAATVAVGELAVLALLRGALLPG